MELISDLKKIVFLVIIGCVLFIFYILLNPSIPEKRKVTVGNMVRIGLPMIILAALFYFVLIR